MVARAGGYFRRPFKGYGGVTQGNPLYTMILNMVVYDIILQWVTGVTTTEAVTGGLGLMIIALASYFYADDGLVASTQP